MNIHLPSIRRLAVISSLVVLSMTAGSGAAVAGSASSSIHLQLSDLNLATASGRQTAYRRLRDAATTVCFRTSEAEDLGRQTHIAQCIERTMAQAMASLQPLVARSEAQQLARSQPH